MAPSKKNTRGFQKNNSCRYMTGTSPKHTKQQVSSPRRPVTRSLSTTPVETNEYYILSINQLNLLINDSFSAHLKNKPTCTGRYELLRTEKRLVSSSWCMKCLLCGFLSTPIKMYKECDTPSNQSGRKLSTLNSSLWVALSFSSIGPSQFSQIMCDIGVYPGNVGQINNQISSAREKLTNLANESMAQERRKLVHAPRVPLSVDGWYNNRARDSPSQPATQIVFTTIENLNGHGKILDCVTQNKLCKKGTVLRNDGKDVVCPSDTHVCTATMGILDAIGQEGKYTSESLKRIAQDNVKIASVTSDGDVAIKKAIRTTLGKDVEVFSDPRHLSICMKRAIKGHTFSKNMFTGKKGNVKKVQGWFADDIRNRLEIEFNSAEKHADVISISDIHGSLTTASDADYQKFQSKKLNTLTNILHDAPDRIINCIKKKSNCKKCAVCENKTSTPFQKKYTGHLNMTKKDEDDLKTLMLKRVSAEAIKSTYMRINTQKNEAFNRCLSKTCPKIMTSVTNFTGRVAASILLNNHGPSIAHMLAGDAVGHQVSEEVKGEWLRKDIISKNHRRRQKTVKFKSKRYSDIVKSYQRYSKLKLNDCPYKKGVGLP